MKFPNVITVIICGFLLLYKQQEDALWGHPLFEHIYYVEIFEYWISHHEFDLNMLFFPTLVGFVVAYAFCFGLIFQLAFTICPFSPTPQIAYCNHIGLWIVFVAWFFTDCCGLFFSKLLLIRFCFCLGFGSNGFPFELPAFGLNACVSYFFHPVRDNRIDSLRFKAFKSYVNRNSVKTPALFDHCKYRWMELHRLSFHNFHGLPPFS